MAQPTLTLSAPTGIVTGKITITATFSKPVSTVYWYDVRYAPGGHTPLTGSGTSWSYEWEPLNASGTLTMRLIAGVYIAGVGAVLLTSNTLTLQFNKTGLPTLVATVAPVSGIQTAAVTVNVTFPSAVTGFDASNIGILADGGRKGSVSNVTGSGTSWAFTWTPVADHRGVNNVSLKGTVQVKGVDTSIASNEILIPFLTVVTPSPPHVDAVFYHPEGARNPLFTKPVTYQVYFASAVTGFDIPDVFNYRVGTVSNVTGSGTSWSFTWTPPTDRAGNATLQLGGQVQVSGVNKKPRAQRERLRYGTGPIPDTITVYLSTPQGTATGPIPVTVTFPFPVIGFDLTDINTSAGVASNLTGAGKSWAFTWTPPPGDDTATLEVTGQVHLSEVSGVNIRLISGKYRVAYHVAATRATLTPPHTPQTGAFNIPVVFTESVTGFEKADVSLTALTGNGVTGVNFTMTGSGTAYTLAFTVPTNAQGGFQIEIPGSVTVSGENSPKAVTVTPVTVYYDTTSNVIIAQGFGEPQYNDAGEIVVPFTFSENVVAPFKSVFPVTWVSGDPVEAIAYSIIGENTAYELVFTVPPNRSGRFRISAVGDVFKLASREWDNVVATPKVVAYATTVPELIDWEVPAAYARNQKFRILLAFNTVVTGWHLNNTLTEVWIEEGAYIGTPTPYKWIGNPPPDIHAEVPDTLPNDWQQLAAPPDAHSGEWHGESGQYFLIDWTVSVDPQGAFNLTLRPDNVLRGPVS